MTAAAKDLTLHLLHSRQDGATVCPSEVARALVAQGPDQQAREWRSVMPEVHEAVDELLAEGLISLSWKGSRLDRRSGPYRIGRIRK